MSFSMATWCLITAARLTGPIAWSFQCEPTESGGQHGSHKRHGHGRNLTTEDIGTTTVWHHSRTSPGIAGSLAAPTRQVALTLPW
jgi:hypothetical protein